MSDLIKEAKRRRVWGVLVAYPGVTFVLLEVVEFFVSNYAFDPRLLTVVLIAAVIFFPAAVVWNWNHGEAGAQAFRPGEIVAYGIVGAMTLAGVGWYWTTSSSDSGPAVSAEAAARSVAVMPFENLGDDTLAYLSDGIAESLINRLAAMPGAQVSAKSASFRMRDQTDDLRALATGLGVSHAVLGSVEPIGDQLIISASLVELSRERTVWGERLTTPRDQALLAERSIASALAEGLELEVSNAPDRDVGGTSNADAYDEYLRGHHLIQATDDATIQRGLTRLRAAIAADPGFARPYAEIADALSQMIYYATGNPAQLIDEARTAAYSAIAIAPDLPEAQVALAAIHQYITFDWDAAETAYRAAIARSPSNPLPYHRYVDFLWAMLRVEEAQRVAQRGIEIDPFDSNSMHAVGIAKLFAGDFAGAAEAFGEWNEFHPESVWSFVKHAVALAYVGECDLATSQIERAELLTQDGRDPLMDAWMAWAFKTCGDEARFERAKAHAEATIDGDRSVALAASWYLAALDGDVEGLMEVIEDVVRLRSPYTLFLPFFLSDRVEWPVSDQIKTNPRYLEIIRELEFPMAGQE